MAIVRTSFGDFHPDWEEIHEALLIREKAHPTARIDAFLFKAVTNMGLISQVRIADKVAVLRGFQAWVRRSALEPEEFQVVLAAHRLSKGAYAGPLHPKYPLTGILARNFTGADEDRVQKGKFNLWNLMERVGLTKFAIDARAEWERMSDDDVDIVSLIYKEW